MITSINGAFLGRNYLNRFIFKH